MRDSCVGVLYLRFRLRVCRGVALLAALAVLAGVLVALQIAAPSAALSKAFASGATSLDTGEVSTVAGGFSQPTGVVVTGAFAYVASADVLTKVTLSSGAKSVLAGTAGWSSCGSDGSTGASSTFYQPTDIATDGSYLYTNETNCGSPIRKTDLSTGATSTLTSGLTCTHFAMGPDVALYLSCGNAVYREPTSGGTPTVLHDFGSPHPVSGVVTDATYAYVLVDGGIDRIALSGGAVTSLIPADGFMAAGPLHLLNGYFYVGSGVTLRRYANAAGSVGVDVAGGGSGHLDGTGAQAWFGAVAGLADDGTNLFVADSAGYLRKVTPGTALAQDQSSVASSAAPIGVGQVTTAAGSGTASTTTGSLTSASFNAPNSVAAVAGKLYVLSVDAISKVDVSGNSVSILSGSPGSNGCAAGDSQDGSGVLTFEPHSLVSDGTFLYVAATNCGGAIIRISIATGATEQIASASSYGDVHGMTIGPDQALYVATGGNDILRLGLRDRALTVWYHDTRADWTMNSLAADDTTLWIGMANTDRDNRPDPLVEGITFADQTVSTLYTDHNLAAGDGLVSAGDYVYAATSDAPNLAQLVRVSKSDGSELVVAGSTVGHTDGTGTGAKFGELNGLAADGTAIWVADGPNNQLRKVVAAPLPTVPDAQTNGEDSNAGDPTQPATNDRCGCPPDDAVGSTPIPGRLRADPVNTATGAYTEQVTDAQLRVGRGVPFTFTRSYTSRDTTGGRLGPGWTDTYQTALSIDSGTGNATLRAGSGAQVLFTKNTDGSFTAAPGSRSVLTAVSGGYTLTSPTDHDYSFDSSGKLLSVLDKHGQGLTFTYTGGQQTGITDGAGHTVILGYTSGLLTSVTLPDGRSVTYGYTGGRLTSVTDIGGHAWAYDYDSGGRLTMITDPRGHHIVTNVYDSSTGRVSQQTNAVGDVSHFAWNSATGTSTVTDPDTGTWADVYAGNVLQSTTDPDGNTTHYYYDDRLDVIAVQDPLGNITTMTHDAAGNLLTRRAPAPLNYLDRWTYNSLDETTAHTDGRGKTTTWTYNSAGDKLSMTTPDGNETTWTYNTDGTVASMVDPRGNVAGANPADYTTSYGYDSHGQQTSVTDPDGNTTTYTYDSAGRKTTVVDPRGNVTGANPANYTTSYTYTARDDLDTVTDALAHATSYGYDVDGNLTSVTDPNTHTTSYGYDNANRRTSITDALTHATTYSYDYAGRTTSITDPDGNKTTSSYDKAGLLTAVTSPRGNVTGATAADYTTTYTYDADGHQLTASHPLPGGGTATTTTTYDALGRVTAVTDPNGHTTKYSYDAAGNRTKVTDARGNITTTSYTDDGHVDTVTDPNTHATSYTYNPAGLLATSTDPKSRTTSYGYDHAGRRTTITAADSAVTTLGYDAAGNLTSRNYSDSTPDVTYTYDADNHRHTMVDGTGTTTDTYDPAGHLTNVTNGAGAVIKYAYNAADQLTTLTYPPTSALPNGQPVTYAHDAAGRVTTITDWASHSTGFGYDADGNVTSTTFPNGVTTTNTYDIANRPTEMKHVKSSTTLADFTYSYDPTNQLTHESDTLNGTTTPSDYTYSASNQLASDPTGNYTQDPANQLTALADGTSLSYDTAGQLTGSTLSGSTTTYGYDQRGDRTSMTPHTGSATSLSYNLDGTLNGYTKGTQNIRYSYNGDGLRMSRLSSGVTNQYTWDVSSDLPRLLDDGTRSYIYGPSGPVEQVNDGTPSYAYLQADRQASTRLLTNATGSVTATYTYGPYGKVTTHTGTGSTPLEYDGEYSDPGTGYIYLRARYYDPNTAQFLTRDPLTSLTKAPYAFVGDDPLNATDPSGLMCRLNPFHRAFWTKGNCLSDGAAAAGSAITSALNTVANGIDDAASAIGHVVGDAASWIGKHPWQAVGIVAGVLAAATGVGALVEAGLAGGVLAGSAGTLAAASIVSGTAAAALDLNSCLAGDKAACVGAALGAVGVLTALPDMIAGLAGVEEGGALLGALRALSTFSLNFGVAGLMIDIVDVFGGDEAQQSSGQPNSNSFC